VLATGNHFVLDVLAGLLTLALALLVVRAPALVAARRRALRESPRFVRQRPRLAARGAAYRMSQTCYEVQDQVD